MKVLLINFNSAGLFHYACSLAEALQEKQEISEVILVTSSFNDISKLQNGSVRVQVFEAPHSPLAFLKWMAFSSDHRKLGALIKKEKPDVIHVLDSYPIYFRYHMVFKKYPIVFTQHDPTPHSGDKFSLITNGINSYLQHLAQRIFVHGEVIKSELVSNYKIAAEKIVSVPLGFFPNLLPCDKNNLQPGSILFFGRIVKYKGLDIFLESLKLLEKKGRIPQATIAGPGDLAPYSSALATVKSVKVINRYISDEEVRELLSGAEIIVMPYKEATQSAVAALALAAGKVVVATRVGALEEVLKDSYNSILVPPNNSTALAIALERLLNDTSLRQRLAFNASKTAKESLNWAKIADRHLTVYRELL